MLVNEKKNGVRVRVHAFACVCQRERLKKMHLILFAACSDFLVLLTISGVKLNHLNS